MVANLTANKNVGVVVDAVAKLRSEGVALEMVHIGSDVLGQLAERVRAHDAGGYVHALGKVSDDELLQRYRQCLCTVVPSLYEGFGMPVLEAQACGAAMICSDRGAVPEAAGEGAILFDPEDASALATAIRLYLEDPPLRHRMQERAFANVANFSWRKTAEGTMGVFTDIWAKEGEPAPIGPGHDRGGRRPDRRRQHESTVSVSFVLYHTPVAEIRRALELVRASATSPSVFLVDNSNPPIDLETAGLDLTGVDVIVMGWNAGYGRGHNAAIPRSRSRYHAVLNTDIDFTGDVLGRLVDFMDERPSAGLVAPRVAYPDGRLQHLCRLLPSPVDIMARALAGNSAWAARRNRRYEVRDWSYDRVAQFPFLSGCFMLFRRSILDRVGGFDERFFMYAEDIDLTRRIRAEAETLFVPDVTIVHDYRSQSGFSLRRQRTRFVNLTRYFAKWGWFFDADRRRINRQTLDELPG